MRKGWFIIPGVQNGDRTIEEQLCGVEKALAECKGKTVLDLGCAEGLLSREFALAGARRVHGIDAVGAHLEMAQTICRPYRCVTFEQCDLHEPPALRHPFDIVLALGIAHKLQDPATLIRYAATASIGLVLVRMTRQTVDGNLTSKFSKVVCNVNDEMHAAGFALEGVEPGPRQETVHYYRRIVAWDSATKS